MRAHPTSAEAIIWQWLRNRRFGGWKFRRQHPVDNYILDFYCEELQLAIELDGEVHKSHVDKQRDHILAKVGIHVVRVKNEEVVNDEAAIHIKNAIRYQQKALSPAGEGGAKRRVRGLTIRNAP